MRFEAEGRESLKLVVSILEGRVAYPLTLEIFLGQVGEDDEPKRVFMKISKEGENVVMSSLLDSLYLNETFHIGRIVFTSADEFSETDQSSGKRKQSAKKKANDDGVVRDFFDKLRAHYSGMTDSDLANLFGISGGQMSRLVNQRTRFTRRRALSFINKLALEDDNPLVKCLRAIADTRI
ncbi:MAG: hypothetical protein WC551_03990 [Patescibacteria group bacterium]